MRLLTLLSAVAICSISCNSQQPLIEPTWESISEYPACPEWFSDAKFGIYTHWTPQSIPEAASNNMGYPSYMYHENRPHFRFHKENYGDQNEFGFKDFIPMFTAEKFDAAQWAEIFAEAGAKFAGPVAVHHDNYALWDSKATKWNSVNMTPHIDIAGELAKEYKKRGMKYIATFHHSWAWGYYAAATRYDAKDPDTWQLYGEPREIKKDNNNRNYINAGFPTKGYLDQWLTMVDEVIVDYEPDMIWFDIAFDGRDCITPEYQKQMFANYYNWANKMGRGVAVGHKEDLILPYTGIKDYERGRSPYLRPEVWMTDGTLGRSWFYQPKFDGRWHDANWIVDLLVEIVSKNGVYLLNVPPRPDGSIPEEGAEILRNIGKWLSCNGEAIYNTIPWSVYGEPHKQLSDRQGRGDESKKVVYSSEDIRFTQSKDGKIVNVFTLGWSDKPFVVKSIEVLKSGKDAKIKLLGSDAKINYSINDKRQLVIEAPETPPCEYAYCYQLSGFDLTTHAEADADAFAKAYEPNAH